MTHVYIISLASDYDTRKQEDGHALDGIRDLALHATRRKPWNKGMGTGALKFYSEILKRRVDSLIGELDRRKGTTIDIGNWVTFLTCAFVVAQKEPS